VAIYLASISRIDLCSLGQASAGDLPARDCWPQRASAGGVRTRKVSVVDANRDATRTAGHTPAKGGWPRSIAMIVIFDVAGPLVLYKVLRSAGMTAVSALLLSGVLPALGVIIAGIRHRRLDVVGALVLAGIVVGAVLGLTTHSARLILVEGSVPTGVIGIAFLGSLWARRPLLYSFALEFIGPDTAKGQEMTLFWQSPVFRRDFRLMTAVWGVGFLLEAALRVVIIYNTSTGTALAISKIVPWLFVAVLCAWTVAHGARQRKKAARVAAAASPAAEESTGGAPSVPGLEDRAGPFPSASHARPDAGAAEA
jgi:hypothetical protein